MERGDRVEGIQFSCEAGSWHHNYIYSITPIEPSYPYCTTDYLELDYLSPPRGTYNELRYLATSDGFAMSYDKYL